MIITRKGAGPLRAWMFFLRLAYESPYSEDGMNPMWSETPPPDECKCKWTNYSDEGGWVRKRRDPDCPIHRGL